jgi:hypothetical protein
VLQRRQPLVLAALPPDHGQDRLRRDAGCDIGRPASYHPAVWSTSTRVNACGWPSIWTPAASIS